MTKRRWEPMDRSRGTPMDAGDLPGSPIRGDSVMGNERASERVNGRLRVRIYAGRGGDRDRENERSPPTHLSPRWANAGAACRRNWLSQRGHITGHYGTLTGRLLWSGQHQPGRAMCTYIRMCRRGGPRASVCVSVRAARVPP